MQNKDTRHFENFEYHLLPAVPAIGFKQQALHDQAFEYWRQFWRPLLADLDGTVLSPADFFRQTWIGALFEVTDGERRVVGLHTSTRFNLESAASVNHPYFQSSYEPDFVEFLKNQGARSFMSIEYLTVDPDYRRSRVAGTVRDFSFIHIILGLAFNLARRERFDVAAGAGRADLKADQRARDFGMTSRPERHLHNVPVTSDYVFAPDIKPCPRNSERLFIENVWNRHFDSIENSQTPTISQEAA